MEAVSWFCDFELRGKDEFEIYKNYISDLPFEKIALVLHVGFATGNLKRKNNVKARGVRIQGNSAYRFQDYEESLRLYTKSLRYATYNSEEYAVALANRSAIYFALEDYKSSIDDINLCLNAKYPNHLKPKVYIRKAKCFQNLGEPTDMRNTLVCVLNYLDSSTALLKAKTVDKYKKIVKDLITATVEKKADPEDKFDALPPLNTNPTFLNASSTIMLKYNKRKGYYVVAKEEIVRGDVLFIEKAYTFAPRQRESPKKYYPTHCQYCLLKITSCIPCKSCVKYLYCNEKCRDAAWDEFHQWECIGIGGGFFRKKHSIQLALRIISKAVLDGIFTDKIDVKDALASYGDKGNNYPYVYSMHTYLHDLEKSDLMEFVTMAALLVNYLKMKTNFFKWMKGLPAYDNKSYKELMNKVGGLVIRHCTQFRRSTIPVRICDNQVDPSILPIATAVCPSTIMINHSCIPNTAFHFIGSTVVVKATKNIKINEEVFYSLEGIAFAAMNKDERQKTLQNLYYFKCNCQICSDPRMDIHDSYLCIKCKGPAAPLDNNCSLTPKKCVCLNCNYKFSLPPDVLVKERLAMKYLARFHLFEDINDANMCLHLCKTILRPSHSIFENLFVQLLGHYGGKGEIDCLIKLAKMLDDYNESLYFVVSLEVGMFQYTQCIGFLQLLKEMAMDISVIKLGEVLEELTYFLEKAKVVFSFHYPQFGVRLKKVEKSIFQLRILHTLRIANMELHNHFSLVTIQ